MKYHKYWKHAQILLRRCIKSAITQPPFLTKYKYKKKCEFKVFTMMIRIPAKCPEGIFCPLHPLPIKARRPKFRFTFISQRDWIQILFSAHSYLDYLAENMKGNQKQTKQEKTPRIKSDEFLKYRLSPAVFFNALLPYDKVSANTASSKPRCYKKSGRSLNARRGSPDMPNEPSDK